MFDNIKSILPIIFKNKDNNLVFYNTLFNDNIIPIGTIITNVEIFNDKDEKLLENILPCVIYKENYKA